MTQPFGRYTAPKRSGGRAGDCAIGVMAGVIDSRNGRATAAPIPRRNARRGNDRLKITHFSKLLSLRSLRSRRRSRAGTHLKRSASYDPQQDGREAVVLRFRVTHDGPDDRHIIMLEPASES